MGTENLRVTFNLFNKNYNQADAEKVMENK